MVLICLLKCVQILSYIQTTFHKYVCVASLCISEVMVNRCLLGSNLIWYSERHTSTLVSCIFGLRHFNRKRNKVWCWFCVLFYCCITYNNTLCPFNEYSSVDCGTNINTIIVGIDWSMNNKNKSLEWENTFSLYIPFHCIFRMLHSDAYH